MYEAFYGLKERPFNLTPDPKYLYLSDKHKEAFAHLLFGIKHRSGFVMVTGEIGTGKTTICRNILKQIDSENTNIAFVFNPPLNPVELIKKINVEFGISSTADNALELTEILNQFLLAQASAGKNCVLVIDEAQNLSPQVLEQVRLLSNLETETEKLLQIVLIGQPELGEKLALHELRQLNQRITARYHLKALSEQETLQYVAYRLHVAGGRRKIQFSKSAIKNIYRASGGTPRVINAICDRALLIGYTKEAVNISASIVKHAASEIRGERVVVDRPLSGLLRQLMPSPSLVLVAVVVIFSVWYLGQKVGGFSDEARRFNDVMLPTQPTPAPSNAVEAKAEPITPPTNTEKEQQDVRAEVAKAIAEKMAPGAIPAESDTDSAAKAFTAALEAATPEATGAAAGEALLAAWAIAPNGTALDEATAPGVAGYFTAHGLSAETLQAGFEQLAAIGLPAVVRLKQGQKELWAALTGVQDATVTVLLGKDQTLTVPKDAFKAAYLAESVIPWQDPEPRASAMSVGRVGDGVAGLKGVLRDLGRLSASNKNDTYDQDVARAVSRVQAETGLIIDGVAGRQMRMILRAWSNDPATPRLAAAPAQAVPRAVATETPVEKPVEKPADKPAPKPLEKPAPPAALEVTTTPLPSPEALNNAIAPSPEPAPESTEPAPATEAPEAPAPDAAQ